MNGQKQREDDTDYSGVRLFGGEIRGIEVEGSARETVKSVRLETGDWKHLSCNCSCQITGSGIVDRSGNSTKPIKIDVRQADKLYRY